MNKSINNKSIFSSEISVVTGRDALPILKALILFLTVGYGVFFVSKWFNFFPSDSILFVYLTKKMAALRMIDRVAVITGESDTMPMKLLMIYVFFGSGLLTFWCMHWSVRPAILQKMLARSMYIKMSTWKMVLCAPVMPLLAIVNFYTINIESIHISWGTVSRYSSSFGSVTQLLVLTAGFAVFQVPLLPMLIHIFLNIKNCTNKSKN